MMWKDGFILEKCQYLDHIVQGRSYDQIARDGKSGLENKLSREKKTIQ